MCIRHPSSLEDCSYPDHPQNPPSRYAVDCVEDFLTFSPSSVSPQFPTKGIRRCHMEIGTSQVHASLR